MRYLFFPIFAFMAFILAGCSEDKVVTPVELYFMEITETEFKLGSETRNFEGVQPDLMPVMEAWLKGPKSPELSRIVSEEVRLLDGFVRNSVAYLDFSPDITQADMGSELESVLIQSIVLTATQVKGVEAVQIIVEGENIESLAGHMLINKPVK